MILQYPLSSEKIVRIMEAENKIVFCVDRRATKKEIAQEFEKQFKFKPIQINTKIKGNKKIAYIKLKADNSARDVATKLGLM